MDGTRLVAGVDEAGRGPLAGPVYAAAVVLPRSAPIPGLADSKLLTAQRRERLAVLIRSQALAWHVARAEVEEIDSMNILQASLLAMRRAVAGLAVAPELALIDGNQCPGLDCATRTIVGGDGLHACISAASILAKVDRDAEMRRLARTYPGYGFERNKGYATAAHLSALQQLGPCPVHRFSFAPVRQANRSVAATGNGTAP